MKPPLIVEREYNPDPERMLRVLVILLTSLEKRLPDAPATTKNEPGAETQATKKAPRVTAQKGL